jgi:hypothetical protein
MMVVEEIIDNFDVRDDDVLMIINVFASEFDNQLRLRSTLPARR